MKLEDIIEQAEKDLDIEQDEIAKEASNAGRLMSKYQKIRMGEEFRLDELQRDRSIAFVKRSEYYRGKRAMDTSKKDAAYDFIVPEKDLTEYLRADEVMAPFDKKILIQRQKLEYLDYVMKMILKREWYLRLTLDEIKFNHGC